MTDAEVRSPNLSPAADHTNLRRDIQVLRGFAVLVVVLYHAGIPGFGAGYLGVDVFFVISGYLITGLIARGMSHGTFSFKAFYLRRAKRLLPAAYVTFLATAVLAPFLLEHQQLIDLYKQLGGGVTLIANVVLWRQSGYFERAAELKPLLHTWSLSLEEQYYLLVPALLFLLPKRCWLLAAAIASMASLALCLWLASTKPYVAFFLLPARAWELGIGSVAALAVSMPDRFAAVLRQAFWPLLSVLVGLCLWRFDTPHPGWQALAICLATVGIIVGRHGWMATNRAVGCLAWVGDLSYSLYLVHWPIFAFMHNTWLAPEGQPLGWSWQLALIALSLVLAWALNRFVEEPFRHAAAPAGKTVVRLLSATLVLLALAFALPWTNDATRDFAYEFRVNYGFDKKCEYENDNDFRPPSECINSATPEVLIWGDSFAMHLVPGLAGEGAKLVQATRSMCAPARGLSVLNERYVHTVAWAKNCMALSESVLGYVSESPSIRYVVLSSPFMQLLKPDDSDEGLLVRRDHAFLREKRSVDTALSALLATASELRRAGKKVIVIAPPPLTGTDFGRCFERSVRGLRTLGVLDGCVFPESIADEYQREVLELLRRLDENGVPVIDLRPALCEGGMCRISIDGLPIYRDSGHLSVAGSEFLGKRMHWLERIKAEAR